MILTISLLIICTLLGGLSIRLIPGQQRNLRMPLIFAGSYLLTITIIHILPEIFTLSTNPQIVGLYVLAGFFFQQLLEYFSSGLEHGHVHRDEILSSGGRLSIVVALIVHSLLEGTLLTHDSPVHERHESYSLLLGIILHKMPAAFALMATMQSLGKKSYYLLILFSLASPLGLVLSEYLILSEQAILIVFAVVGGSFLHISTTIFVESSPEHRFGFNKIFISMLGALLAILVEFLG